jgi:predicted secreted protein
MTSKLVSFLAAGLVFLALLAGHVSSAAAALCGKCRDLMFTDSQGRCIECGGPTSSGALQLCPKCSAKRQQCEHCLATLSAKDDVAAEAAPAERLPGPALPDSGEGEHPPARTVPANGDAHPKSDAGAAPLWTGALASPDQSLPAARADRTALLGPASALPPEAAVPSQVKPINPARPGTYTAGKWRFQMQIANPGARGEGHWGMLTYDGQKLPRGNVNDYYITPWGPMYWVGAEKTAWGLHGFMPVPSPQSQRQGRALALPAGLLSPMSAPAAVPALGKAQTLEINRSHNGQLARMRVGNLLIIRLPGNPASGFEWQVGTTNTPALRLTVAPQYSPAAAAPSGAVMPGSYTFVYQAVQPGAGPLRLYYVRPADRSHPRDSFAIGVQVAPATVVPALH